MKEPSVSILVLNWNGKEVLKKCLSSLLKLTNYKNFKIIVVDNASADGSVEMVKKEFGKKVDLIINKQNLGFVKGNNIGIKYVIKKYKPDYVLLLNNDTEIVDKDWLKKLVVTAEAEKKIGIIGPRLIFPNGRNQWCARKRERNIFRLIIQTLTASGNPGIGEKNVGWIGEANTISGACMMIRSEMIKTLGLLDEELQPFFGEDVEYCFRAHRNGWKVYYRGDIEVIHKQSYTFQKLGIRREKFYYSLRNGLKICKKYFGTKGLIVGLPVLLFSLFFERKNKERKLSLLNLKPRDNPFILINMFIKIVKEVLR